jgi:hypothetical protein
VELHSTLGLERLLLYNVERMLDLCLFTGQLRWDAAEEAEKWIELSAFRRNGIDRVMMYRLRKLEQDFV